MIIGVDGGCLGIRDMRLKVGVYQVVKELFEELAVLDRQNTYLLYTFYPIDASLLKSFGSRVRNVVVTPSKGWMKVWLPLQIMQDRIDIFLALNHAVPFQVPFSKPYKVVGFVYDVAFERYPLFFSDPVSVRQLHTITSDLCKRADCLLTISEATKHDIGQVYGFALDRIFVAYPGFRKELGFTSDSAASKRPYFLFVGAFKKIKNVPGLLRGFSYFLKMSGKSYDLLLVGSDKWLDRDIQEVLDHLPKAHRKRVRIMGFVSDEMLAGLYKGAIVFVSPSFYEGFGMPFLEAMSMGVPVIGGNAGSIPEVVGNAGILVDPHDSEAIGRAMSEIVTNEKKRMAYIKRGFTQARKFSSKKFAREVLRVIEGISFVV